jgi:hypothetical protein
MRLRRIRIVGETFALPSLVDYGQVIQPVMEAGIFRSLFESLS